MKAQFLCIICLLSTLSFGQATPTSLLSERLKKLDEKTKSSGSYASFGKHFFFNSTDQNDTTFKCDYSVIYDRKRDLFNIVQIEQFVIQDKEIMLVIDTANMQIVVNKPNEALKNVIKGDKVLENNKYIKEVTLNKRNADETFKISFSEKSSIGSMSIRFSKDGLIARIVTTAAYPIPDPSQGREVMVQPRMEVVFSKYLFGTNVKTSEMKSVADVYNAENKTLMEAYKHFQLIDLRYNPTNK